MPEGAFFQQSRFSPTGIAVVVAMHAAGLGALILAKGPGVDILPRSNPEVFFVPLPPEPPIEVPPAPRPPDQPVQQRTEIDVPRPIIQTPTQGPVIRSDPIPTPIWTNTAPGNDIVVEPPAPTPPPPPPPLPPRVVEAARARGSLQGLFRPNDYPVSAAESNAQGSTGVRLTIGPDGRVTACSVTRPSGSRALDTATCSVLRARARYTPARDQNDQPVGDTQGATITWRLSSE